MENGILSYGETRLSEISKTIIPRFIAIALCHMYTLTINTLMIINYDYKL